MMWLHSIGVWVPVGLALVGLAVFATSALGCGGAPCKEKDELFHREVY